MRKLKLEKITGVVALSYLVLIPVGAIYAWRRVQDIDKDVTALCIHLNLPTPERQPLFDLERVKERLGVGE